MQSANDKFSKRADNLDKGNFLYKIYYHLNSESLTEVCVQQRVSKVSNDMYSSDITLKY